MKSRVPHDVFELRHEAFVAEPQRILRDLCGFLALKGDDQYYQACAKVASDFSAMVNFRMRWFK